MTGRSIRRRFLVELGFAGASGLLTAMTVVAPDWIELLFGIEPDAAGGTLELAMTAAMIAITVGLGTLARLEWRRSSLARA
jgi:hypothetical protein